MEQGWRRRQKHKEKALREARTGDSASHRSFKKIIWSAMMSKVKWGLLGVALQHRVVCALKIWGKSCDSCHLSMAAFVTLNQLFKSHSV